MKDLMMLYGVTLGRRYKKKEKEQFLTVVSTYFTQLNYSVCIQTKKSAYSSVHNMIIGDLKRANKVLVAAYDTPTTVAIPNYRYYPFNVRKNLRNENINLLLHFLVSCLIFVVLYFVLRDFMVYSIWKKIISMAMSIIGVLIAYFLIRGIGNRVNFNRNSAAIVLMHDIARKYKKDDLAFVFLDQCVNSYEGLKALQEEFEGKNKSVIMLDALAQGEQLILVHKGQVAQQRIIANKAGLQIYGKPATDFINDKNMLSFFPDMIYLASGENENKQFVVKNTRSRKDVDVDIPRLEKISEVLIDYMKGE